MTLEIEARLEPAEILFQQSAACAYRLKNAGGAPLELVPPGRRYEPPDLRRHEPASGEEQFFQNASAEFLPDPEPDPLDPGAELRAQFDLLCGCTIDRPGEYEVTLVFPYGPDDEQRAESPPVRLVVRPSTPEALSLGSVRGAPAALMNAAWVNTAHDPPQLVRGSFDLSARLPKLQEVDVLGPLAPGSRPCVSVPPNHSVSRDHWTAWLEGDRLRALHYGELPRPRASAPRELRLPSADAELVAALHTETPPEGPGRAEGAALVWHAAAPQPRLLEVALRPAGLAEQASAPFPGPRPVWLRTLTHAAGERRLHALQVQGDAVTLQGVSWPSAGGAPRREAEWPGRLIAAAAELDLDDAVQGALLMWMGARPKLRLIRWRRDAGGWRELGRETLGWEDAAPPVWGQLALSVTGTVAALLRDAGGRLLVYRDGDRVRRTAPALARHPHPLQLVFANEHDPILLRARAELGWEGVQLDGTAFVR